MIEVNNLTTDRVNKKKLKKLAEKVLAAENKKIDLSIALVGEKRIRELNKKYRKKDKPTDVLSFNYGASGEVVLCPRQIEGKIDQVLVHGILHILGYNHREMKNFKING